MDEAAEDFSCNIMPELLPAPYIPPPPPRLLSPIRSTRRHEILLFFSAMTIFFFFQLDKKKACRLCYCGQPSGCTRKKKWVSLTQIACMNVQEPDKIQNLSHCGSAGLSCVCHDGNMCILLLDDGKSQHEAHWPLTGMCMMLILQTKCVMSSKLVQKHR